MSDKFFSLLPGGFFSASPYDKSTPASIRCNNPGAINGASWEKTWPGYLETVQTTPGNFTTIFAAPECGVSAWYELLRRYAGGGADTLLEVITRYGGGQDYSGYVAFVTKRTGFAADRKIDLGDDDLLLALAKAMFRFEAGRETPLSDAQILFGLQIGRNGGKVEGLAVPAAPLAQIRTPPDAPSPLALVQTDTVPPSLDSVAGVRALQRVLIAAGYLDPPDDGNFGPVTKWALGQFAFRHGLPFDGTLPGPLVQALEAAEPLPLSPGNDLAGRLVRAMQKNGYWIARHPDCMNIAYVEGMDPDGSPNDNANNVFNDLRIVFQVGPSGVPKILGQWEATTEPSRKYTLKPMNAGGAFHIKFGQYKAWIRGIYHKHEALLQVGEISGYRDPGKTFKRDFNHPVTGAGFGVHHHWGYDLPHDDMGSSSAGCLVGRSTKGHLAFIALLDADPRYKAFAAYRFMAAILPAGDL